MAARQLAMLTEWVRFPLFAPIEKGKVTAKLSLSENGWEGRRGVTPVLNTGSRKGQVRLLPHPLTVRLSYARAFTEGRWELPLSQVPLTRANRRGVIRVSFLSTTRSYDIQC